MDSQVTELGQKKFYWMMPVSALISAWGWAFLYHNQKKRGLK